MKKILEKLLCNHKWIDHAKVERECAPSFINGRIESTTEILICEKCGRIKKLIY